MKMELVALMVVFLLQLYAYKRYSGRVGEGKELFTTSALSLASEDLEQWWANTGIKTKTHKGIIYAHDKDFERSIYLFDKKLETR